MNSAGSRLGLRVWHPAVLIATGCGAGLIPKAPGTFGSLAALPIAWVIRMLWGVPGLAVAVAVVFVIGCWAAAAVAGASRIPDPGAVVVDEIAGQWLALLAAPLDPLSWALGFAFFRLFDIWKPWPVGWLDRHITGGIGIMLDDMAAAVYALCALEALSAIGGAVGVRI